MTDLLIEAGTLTASREERTVTGLLLPFEEEGRTNLGRLTIGKGVVRIPRDPSVIGANIGHDREQPVGRAVSVAETDAGVVATFSIADTDEGDELLAEIEKGTRKRLSAEVKGIVIKAGRAVSGALFGAAFVEEGAFPSAGLYAQLAEDTEPTEQPDFESRIAELEQQLAALTQTPEDSTEETEETPEEDPTEPETAEQEEEPEVATPSTLAAGAVADKEETGASGVFELIAKARSGMGDAEAETLLAALADIKISGTGALPVSGVLQPKWLGEVWANRTYERRYHSLIKNGNIEALEEKGFKLSTGSELVQSWAGNKAELPTGTATTSVVTGDALQKWGFAVDIAREFFDIPAGRPIVEAFIREIANSYARVTDKWVLQKIVAAAGSAVVRDTYPTGYSTALGKLIQGVDTIDDTDVTPSFAIVAPNVWTELRRTPKDLLPEYISFSFGRQDGTADGVTVVRDKAGVLSAGQVLVGSREAAHVNELPGAAPLMLDALDLARGGIDKAAVGYSQFMTEYAPGFILLGEPA